MTTQYVLAYVPRKMKELGAEDRYVLSFRDLTLKNKQSLQIKADGEYYYFVDGFTSEIRITSETGVYDLLDDKINEMQHEHTGTLSIVNKGTNLLHLQFIVAIPKND